jgi:formylglycine-generating enzyme required for sulfatase activity
MGISEDELKHFPVESVSWNDVQAFLRTLNERERKSGWLYRLPTEAEWEYACRGGPISKEQSAYHFYAGNPSNDLSSESANFRGIFPAGTAPRGKDLQRTSRVGQYPANALGLHDMHGNVSQLCADPPKSGGPSRPTRGGNWYIRGASCAASTRGGLMLRDASIWVGFRLLAVPSGNK